MKKLTGIVKKISDRSTAVVEVERLVPHEVYGKIQRRTTAFKVDFQGADLKVGDKVSIVETRPISKDKNFRVYQKDISKGSEKQTQKQRGGKST